MPTYEYACRDCAQHLEVVQSFRDDALTVCPACGGTLRKVFSAAGIIFKGSGYYVNDSRAGARAGSSDGDSAADAKKTDDAKTDGAKADAAKGDAAKADAAKADAAKGDSGRTSGPKGDGGAKAGSRPAKTDSASSDKKSA